MSTDTQPAEEVTLDQQVETSQYDFDDPTLDPEHSEYQPEEGAATEPAEESEQGEQAESQFSEDLTARAESLGLSLEDFTPESLGRTLAALDRAAVGRQAVPPQTEDQKHQTQQASKLAEQFKIELDPSEYDPKVIEHFEKLRDHFAGQFEQLQQQTQALVAHYTSEQEQKFTAWADDKFSGLGEAFESTFGKGSVRKISQPHVSARNEVIQLAGALQERDPQLSDESSFQRALRALHYDKFENQTRQEISKKVAAQSKGIVGTPTRKQTRERSDPMQDLREMHKRMLAENEAGSAAT